MCARRDSNPQPTGCDLGVRRRPLKYVYAQVRSMLFYTCVHRNSLQFATALLYALLYGTRAVMKLPGPLGLYLCRWAGLGWCSAQVGMRAHI